MAKHAVEFIVPTRELGKSDVHFFVKRNGDTFGKLEVSRGALVWYPRGKQKGHKVTWRELDNFVEERDKKRVERRKKA